MSLERSEQNQNEVPDVESGLFSVWAISDVLRSREWLVSGVACNTRSQHKMRLRKEAAHSQQKTRQDIVWNACLTTGQTKINASVLHLRQEDGPRADEAGEPPRL
ncbi:hypothetical protein L596_016608 [Steinernema carpocapsae]|uniref:Uncharacterized protein n=1 Tax=Steinernema carpocapsae TaxID=34508 RepID=A0A4U5NJE6_STECR|nr:hypothetical protein L596_016608 [Steinernema carpocapsae]